MPKPFIDKRKATSFHVVHRSLDESQLTDNDPDNYYDRYVLPTSSSSSSAQSTDTAQATASTSASTGKYYLQPTSRRHGKGSRNRINRLPSDFPVDLIHKIHEEEAFHPTAVAALERAYNRRYQLDVESSDPSRLPYEYNYAAHLKSISDSGIFITAGGKIIGDMTELKAQEQQSGTAEHISEEQIFGDELQQVNTTQIKEIIHTQKQRSRRHERARYHRDFKLALTDDDGVYDGQWEELEDDFVSAAMNGEDDSAESKDDADGTDGSHRKHRQHDSVFDDIDEEGEDDDEDGFDTAYDDIDAQLNDMKLTDYDTNADYYDDGDEEGDELYDSDDNDEPANPTGLDTAFDALLHDEYSDDDIGELDPNRYYEGELDGKASIDEFQSVFDEYAGKATDNYINGGARVEIDDEETKSVASMHINRLAKQREYTVDEVYEQVNSEYAPKARPQWDAESIVSTYSNIENHPTLIGQTRRKPRPQVVRTQADKQIQLDKHGVPIIDVSQKLQQLGLNPMDEDDAEGDDAASDMLSSMSIRTNDGSARDKAESTAEKKQRKQLAKLQKRLARERKSGTKELFNDAKLAMEKQQVSQRAAWNVGNTIKL